MKKILIFLSLVISQLIIAQEKNDYPELQVTPRATERIQIEAGFENEKPWAFQAPISISALTTLAASFVQSSNIDTSKDSEKYSRTAGLAVGGTWLLMNLYMGYQNKGFSGAQEKISGLSYKTSREQLIKERMAEEEIFRLGRIGRMMKWGSFTTNLAASAYMFSKAKKDTSAKLFDGAAIIASFLPLIFDNHYENVAREQQQYKKKIFGNISSTFLLFDKEKNKFNPGIGLTASF